APDSDAIDMGVSDFSVAFFVQTTDTGGAMLDKRVGPPYRGYSVYFDSSAIGMQLADGDWQNFPATVTINDGQWHHVAITVDRDQADGLKFYIDGAFLTADDPTARSGDLSNTSPLFWGDNFDGGFSMIGLLDEMGLYQRVLTPEEIELLAQGQAVDGDVCE
ncbi:MAG TPA: LamG domain-containing protein, partial [Polyangiaceae bacterium]|nr:LamG domain-containing protein [Polyangiaceae bacterium]